MKITFIKTGKRVKPKETHFRKNADKEKHRKTIGNKSIKKTDNSLEKHNKNNKKTDNTNNKKSSGEFIKTIFKKNQIIIITLALMLVTAGYMNYNNKSDEENISIAELGDARLVNANITEESQGNEVQEVDGNIDGNTDENTNDDIINNNVNNNINNNTNENIIKNQENNLIETDAEVNDSRLSKTENEVKTSNAIESNSNLQNAGSTTDDSQNYFVQTRLERDMMYSQMLETYQKIMENEKIPADQKAIATNEIKNINDRKNAISIVENLIKTKGFKDDVILINGNNIDVVVKQEKNLSEEQVAQITNIVSRELNAEIADIHITVHK